MAARTLRRSAPVMGTVATVELSEGPDAPRLMDETFAWLREVDRRFSTFRDDSEVNRLDRGDLGPTDCSDDLREVLGSCADLWHETDGYFDVYATGRFDPSGYVKGWSVQVASQRLTAAGAADHLVDAGGDVQTRGRPAPGRVWEIGIRHPWDAGAVCAVVRGTDLAVATSGTYERGLHVVDPRTGRPADALRSVTVVGRDLGQADAFATAALAMGPAARRWLAARPDHDCLIVTADGRCFRSDRPAGALSIC